jgi:hypothetical protein
MLKKVLFAIRKHIMLIRYWNNSVGYAKKIGVKVGKNCRLMKVSFNEPYLVTLGRAFDNIMVERLWRTVKYEEVYIRDYKSPVEARFGLRRYLNIITGAGDIAHWLARLRRLCMVLRKKKILIL